MRLLLVTGLLFFERSSTYVAGCSADEECLCNGGNAYDAVGECEDTSDDFRIHFPTRHCNVERYENEQCICNADGRCDLQCMDFEPILPTDAGFVDRVLKDPTDSFLEIKNVRAFDHGCHYRFTKGHVMGGHVTGDPLVPEVGIIMGTGKPTDFCWNDSTRNGHAWNTAGDADIDNITRPYPSTDACAIAFDFKCAAPFPEWNLHYVFGSEHYEEYIHESANDVFAFLLNGENVAVLPGGRSPVSINSVNHEKNSEYYVDNHYGPYHLLHPIIEADGFTTKLAARSSVVQDQWNTMKIVIADVNDFVLDSFLLLEAGSMTCRSSSSLTPWANPSMAPFVSSIPSASTPSSPDRSTAQPSELPSSQPSNRPSLNLHVSSSELPSSSGKPSLHSGEHLDLSWHPPSMPFLIPCKPTTRSAKTTKSVLKSTHKSKETKISRSAKSKTTKKRSGSKGKSAAQRRSHSAKSKPAKKRSSSKGKSAAQRRSSNFRSSLFKARI